MRIHFIPFEGPFRGGSAWNLVLDDDGEETAVNGRDKGIVRLELVVPVAELLHLPLRTIRL